MSVSLKQIKWRLLASLCVLFVSLFGIYQLYASWATFKSVSLPIPDCDLRQGPCVSTLPTGESITLSIKPTHMPVLTSVQIDVKTKKIKAKKMVIYFKGAEMKMGEFKYNLTRQKDNAYSTQTILPTCIHDQMVWHAVIYIETANKRYSAPFIFINERPLLR